MSYDKTYSKSKDFFGSQPDLILKKHISLINRARPVLDIGAGQGRNSFFLAQNGIDVMAIDPSHVAVNTINQAARENKLSITAIKADFDHFVPTALPYSAICIFGLIQLLSWDEIDHLREKIDCWLDKNGILFLTAFSTDDPSYENYKKSWTSAGDNSFKGHSDDYRTFLAKDEILALFKSYKVAYHWEGIGERHRHGDGEPHRHGLIHAIFCK
jgi:SAM-dependent methyltransferase